MIGNYPVTIGRSRVGNGGDEWYLLVAHRRVPMPGDVGIFTDPGVEPADMLARLLRRAMEYTPPVEAEDVGPGPGRDHMR